MGSACATGSIQCWVILSLAYGVGSSIATSRTTKSLNRGSFHSMLDLSLWRGILPINVISAARFLHSTQTYLYVRLLLVVYVALVIIVTQEGHAYACVPMLARAVWL